MTLSNDKKMQDKKEQIACHNRVIRKVFVGVMFSFLCIMLIVIGFNVKRSIEEKNYKNKIKISNDAFCMAEQYEASYNYVKAIELYAKVIPEDEQNYNIAIKKMDELQKSIIQSEEISNAIKEIRRMYPRVSTAKVVEVYIAKDTYFFCSR